MLGIKEIQEIIPHRHPFLLVDVIEQLVPGERATGYKCVTYNEPFFQGHFPEMPVMPGVLMVESMAQAASIIGEALTIDLDGTILFAGIDDCSFSGIATAGDILIIESIITKIRGPFIIGDCTVKKDDKIIAKCSLKAFKKKLN